MQMTADEVIESGRCFAAVHESGSGLNGGAMPCRVMAAVGGCADVLLPDWIDAYDQS
jgi:hypothetical protein